MNAKTSRNSNCVSQSHFFSTFLQAGKNGPVLRIMLPVLTLSFAVAAHSQQLSYLPGSAGFPAPPPGAVLKASPSPLPARVPASHSRLQTTLAAPTRTKEAIASTNYSYTYINIPNTAFVQPVAINNHDVVTGYYADENFVYHGFVWQQGTAQTIDYPGSVATFLSGINDHGVLIGTYQDANYATYTVTYSLADASWSVLPAIPGGWQEIFGIAQINDDGIAIGCAVGAGYLSWMWHPDSQTYSYFTASAATEASTCAFAVSGKRHAMGTFVLPYSNAQFLFLKDRRDEFTSIPVPLNLQGTLFSPFALNNYDTIVGTLGTATSISGFIRTRDGAFEIVNVPDYDQTYLAGLNDTGVLCGNVYSVATGASPGFIAYPGKQAVSTGWVALPR